MAAVGLLRTCTVFLHETLGRTRLVWRWRDPDWIAALETSSAVSSEGLLDALASLPINGRRDEFAWRDEVKKLTREEFRERAGSGDRGVINWLAALTAENPGASKEKPVTPFDTTAGQWKLLAKFRAVHGALFPLEPDASDARAKFKEALFDKWIYGDAEICFNWDPDLVPEGAYCAGDPAKTEKASVLAATWLAIESLPLFPCDWTARRLRTRGFVMKPAAAFSWPVWTTPLSLAVLGTVLGMPELVAPAPPLAELRRRGIVAVFRSRRWNPTNYGAFSQATLCRGAVSRPEGS